jgi:hypothetical protein
MPRSDSRNADQSIWRLPRGEQATPAGAERPQLRSSTSATFGLHDRHAGLQPTDLRRDDRPGIENVDGRSYAADSYRFLSVWPKVRDGVEDALEAHRIDRAGRSRSVCSRVGSRCQEYALPSSSAQAGREWVNASSASSVRARHAVREISPFGRCPFAPPDLLRRSAVNQKFLGGHVRPGPPSRAGRVGRGSGAIRVSQGWQVLLSKSPRTDPGTPSDASRDPERRQRLATNPRDAPTPRNQFSLAAKWS